MKRILSVILSVLMLLSIVSLAGCGESKETVKLGLGIHSYISEVKDAKDAMTNGGGSATTTAAVVLLDKNGKIVDCNIDTLDAELAFNKEGKFVKTGEFATKHEKGDAYGMKQAGAAKEWFEQVDAFETSVKGKNITEVKAMMTEEKKGNDEIVKAGCTITISDFVIALEKAVENAVDSAATSENTTKIGIVANQSSDSKDAKGLENGVNKVTLAIAALAVDGEGKITAASTDALDATVEFDAKGASKTVVSDALKTKKTLGDDYNMKSASPIQKEWYEQANAFASQVVGKSANDVSSLIDDKGYGVEAVQTAGCTINVWDMMQAVVKALSAK